MMDSPGPFMVMSLFRPAGKMYLQGTVCQEVGILCVWGLKMNYQVYYSGADRWIRRQPIVFVIGCTHFL